MFKKLCGDTTLNNVAVVTNMWGEVTPEVGQEREHELSTNSSLFKPVLARGAKMLRHDGTLESAQNTLRTFLDKFPVTLQIQHEIVNEAKTVCQTTAGALIEEQKNREREEQRRQYEEQLRREREQAEQEKRQAEERRQRELEAARIAHEAELARQRAEQARQAAIREQQRRQEKLRIAEMQRQLQAQEAARRAQEAEAERIRQQVAEQARRDAEERARLQAQMEAIRREDSDDGLTCVVC